MLLAGEDSPQPKKRSVGEASEGEVQVVDEGRCRWLTSPQTPRTQSGRLNPPRVGRLSVIVIRCFGAMHHTNLTAVLKSKPL